MDLIEFKRTHWGAISSSSDSILTPEEDGFGLVELFHDFSICQLHNKNYEELVHPGESCVGQDIPEIEHVPPTQKMDEYPPTEMLFDAAGQSVQKEVQSGVFPSEFLFVEFANENPFNCQSCGQNIDALAGLVVPGCLHEVCKPCLERSVAQDHELCATIIPSTGRTCSTRLATEFIRSNVSPEEFERYQMQQLEFIYDLGVIPNNTEFNCSICLERIAIRAGIVLRDCIHEVCRECLRQLVLHSQEAEIKCPFMDDDYSCQSAVMQCEIREILNDEEFEAYLARTLSLTVRRIPNAFYCKTPDCEGFCILEDDINLFECPVCNAANCITCRAIHEGLNCKQYQEWMLSGGGNSQEEFSSAVMLDSLIESGEAMRCPKCKIVLMKKEGCDSLICTMCKTHICWVTRGPRWGPAGVNDTSGGCGCIFLKKPCHPECRNCH